MKTASATEMQSQFAAYLKHSQTAPVVVTKKGRPVAMLVAVLQPANRRGVGRRADTGRSECNRDVALMTAGLVICAIGSTTVFVTEDLDFMSTTASELCGANPRLVPLIAHDRATFGGVPRHRVGALARRRWQPRPSHPG